MIWKTTCLFVSCFANVAPEGRFFFTTRTEAGLPLSPTTDSSPRSHPKKGGVTVERSGQSQVRQDGLLFTVLDRCCSRCLYLKKLLGKPTIRVDGSISIDIS